MILVIKNFQKVIEDKDIARMNRELYQFLTLSCGFRVDLTGSIPVLQNEDGRILYTRKKGGGKHVERTNKRRTSKNTQTL